KHAPQQPTLFPYTTLFRSHRVLNAQPYREDYFEGITNPVPEASRGFRGSAAGDRSLTVAALIRVLRVCTYLQSRDRKEAGASLRSEEHTSELQSRGHLVCR